MWLEVFSKVLTMAEVQHQIVTGEDRDPALQRVACIIPTHPKPRIVIFEKLDTVPWRRSYCQIRTSEIKAQARCDSVVMAMAMVRQ